MLSVSPFAHLSLIFPPSVSPSPVKTHLLVFTLQDKADEEVRWCSLLTFLPTPKKKKKKE